MKLLRIHESDNVAVALKDIHAGESLGSLTALNEIPSGHKIALQEIPSGKDVIKYGQPIGMATETIRAGEHVHTHNLKTKLSETAAYRYEPDLKETKALDSPYVLKAYRRKSGKVGIRNELWVINTVGCINSVAGHITEVYRNTHDLSDTDGIYTFPHPYGCSQMAQDHEMTVRLLRNIIAHPNAGTVLILGLGCENNQLQTLYDGLTGIDPERIRYFNCQDVQDETETALSYLEELHALMRHDKREEVSFADLTFGLECGGSDGFSGISANPLLGRFSDRVIAYGGNVVLSEVPEMFGAEQLLMNRAKDEKVYEEIVGMIEDYKNYFTANGQTVYENPSPGNKKGGITTLEDKSCGCIQKGGTAIINGTIAYGDIRREPGLNLLYGNDPISVTALGAAGCQLVLFTTGRGTPFGSFVPTVKTATNSAIYEHKKSWFDFNAGKVLEGCGMDELCDILMEQVVDHINGRKTRNEEMGHREIAIFKNGVIL